MGVAVLDQTSRSSVDRSGMRRLRHCPEDRRGGCEPGLRSRANAAGEQTVVTDTVEAPWQDVNEENRECTWPSTNHIQRQRRRWFSSQVMLQVMQTPIRARR